MVFKPACDCSDHSLWSDKAVCVADAADRIAMTPLALVTRILGPFSVTK
jgi:hypothetical protein